MLQMDTPAQATTWYEATAVESPPRPRLTFDLDVDVCVIGGGLAGLTVAREVARRGWSVAVLEANRIAEAASGRGAGFVMPGYAEDIDTMVERIGLDHTKELWALSQAGVDYVRRAIKQDDMSGVDPVPGWLNVSKTDNWRELRAKVERLRWLGADVEAWPTERVREQLASENYFGAMHFPSAFHIHPLNYAYGLARAAEAAGARIFEDTPAVELDVGGVRKRIQTPAARLRAPHVVLTANVQLGSLLPRLGATLMPMTSYLMVSEPVAEPIMNLAIRYRGAVTDTRRVDNHYRVIGGNRLQWMGRLTTWEAKPAAFARSLQAGIARLFPQLPRLEIAHLWSGTFGRTLHHMPQIGEVQPGVWVASGFGTHGLNTSAVAGELVARGIVENDQTWRLFAPYELVWAGGRVFRAAAQAIYLVSRPLEGIKEALSRGRERARRRGELRSKTRAERKARTPVAVSPPVSAAAPVAAPAAVEPQKKKPRARGGKTATMLPVPDLADAEKRKKT
jgi:gamma-glutamylputrescine oxidase